MTSIPSPPVRRKRVRLKPEVRSRLILDAAIVEFSRHGFAATRIEDIATRAGLTKTGVYAHFAGKEAIFESLLTHMLMGGSQDAEPFWRPAGDESLEAMVDCYLDEAYRKAQDPMVAEIFRLVLGEGERIPGLLERWHGRILERRAREQAVIDGCIQRGVIRKSPLTDLFPLAMSPAFVWMISRLVFKSDDSLPLDQVRAIHREMLLEVLRPK